MNRREFLETIPLLTITGLAAYRLIEPQTSNDPSMPTMETINYKKQKVNFIGVRHTQETLDKHSTFIEESIKNSNVILLEEVPIPGQDATYGTFLQGDGEEFFSEIMHMCNKHNKYICTFDPSQDITSSIYTYFLTSGTTGLALGPLISLGLINREKLSRRTVLKLLGTSGTAGVIDLLLNYQLSPSFSLFKFLLLGKNWQDDENNFSGLKQMVADMTNYRNATVSLHLKELLDRAEEKGTILNTTLIYGKTHIKALEYYLENPQEAQKIISRPESQITKIFNNNKVKYYVPFQEGWRESKIDDMLKPIN